jgi:hypothetical protein
MIPNKSVVGTRSTVSDTLTVLSEERKMMRQLFLVLAKLVGLLQLYSALSTCVQFGSMLTIFGPSDVPKAQDYLPSLIPVAISVAMTLGLAWLLLARTEWLADRLKIQDAGQIAGLDKQPIFLVGVKLIGLYMTVYAVLLLGAVFAQYQEWIGHNSSRYIWYKVFPGALQLLLGLLLALNAEKVVEIMTKKKKLTEQPTPPYSENHDGSSKS